MNKHPMQPLIMPFPSTGIVRFKANAIVQYLLDHNGEGVKIDMITIACMEFSQEDRVQFAQLIGYSLAGFHELSYVPDETALAATELAKKTFPLAGGCRDDGGCEIHSGVEVDLPPV